MYRRIDIVVKDQPPFYKNLIFFKFKYNELQLELIKLHIPYIYLSNHEQFNVAVENEYCAVSKVFEIFPSVDELYMLNQELEDVLNRELRVYLNCVNVAMSKKIKKLYKKFSKTKRNWWRKEK